MFQQSVRIIFACLFVTGALVSDPATCTTTIPEEVRCAIGALLLGSASEADTESVEARLDFRFSMRASLGEIEAGDFAEADMLGFLERDSGRVIFVVNRRSGTTVATRIYAL